MCIRDSSPPPSAPRSHLRRVLELLSNRLVVHLVDERDAYGLSSRRDVGAHERARHRQPALAY
eukprot:405548-Pleurochrysis_carterae.AAC.1